MRKPLAVKKQSPTQPKTAMVRPHACKYKGGLGHPRHWHIRISFHCTGVELMDGIVQGSLLCLVLFFVTILSDSARQKKK